jgi:hypothetical protein
MANLKEGDTEPCCSVWQEANTCGDQSIMCASA